MAAIADSGKTTLAARMVTALLVVTIPGTALLAAVTAYSLRSLVTTNQRLEEVSRSLEATWSLHQALEQAVTPVEEHLLHDEQDNAGRFDRLIRTAENGIATCASAACHGVDKTPAEMAGVLSQSLEELKTQGRSILAARVPEDGVEGLERMRPISELMATLNPPISRMTSALLVRVEGLHREAQSVLWRAAILISVSSLGIVFLACAVAIFVAKRISDSLDDLLEGTRRVMAGDWDFRVVVRESKEIGEVAASFNAMMRELRRHRARLEEHGEQLEERERERTRELERKDEALRRSEKLASLGRLASGVAHELNNPLTSILMNANLITEELGSDSPFYEELRRIDQDATRCKRIVEDLRAFSRSRALERTRCRLESVIGPSLAAAQHELGPRKIEIDQAISPDLPELLLDMERILQVLSNLFVNAAHAMPRGGRLTIRAYKERSWIALEVGDNGEGIAPEHRYRVFDPFFTTKREGTGLGLSISYGIIQDHGGRIEIASRTRGEVGPESESGTTVRLLLPLSETGE